MNIQDVIWHLPGIVAIKDLEHRYIALSRDTANSIFEIDDYESGLKDCDIPGPISELSDTFVKSDKDVLASNVVQKALNIGKWSDEISGAMLAIKKPYYVDNKLIGVSINATMLDVRVHTSLRYLLNQDLLHSINKGSSHDLTVGYKYGNLSKRAQYCLFFLFHGISNKDIASSLKCSARTVEHYITELKDYFNVSKKSQVIDSAVSAGFPLDIPDFIFEHCCTFDIF